MSKLRHLLILLFAAGWFWPDAAHAGMPSITLTDVARLRFQTISFFLMGGLTSAWVVKVAWNVLQRDFQKLPRLSYGRALAVVGLWGLLFILVLTMISGARELMTPGAWERQGWTYQLASDPDPATQGAAADADETSLDQRRAKLAQLGTALLAHAARNAGQFPSQADFDAWDEEPKTLPDLASVPYFYVPGRIVNESGRILAYEPNVYGDESLVLMTDGLIQAMTPAELREALNGEPSP